MPSLEHEELVELFSRDPALALSLAASSGQLTLPAYDTLELAPAEVRDLVPASLRVDVVILLRRGEPVLVLLVEVQLGRDEDKRFSWPFYVAAMRLKYRCPVCLLVYAVSDAMARWCGQPIELGQPGSAFVPMVVGPGQVPRVTSEEEARAAPYRAVLSALAHGKSAGAEEVARAAWAGIADFGEDERLVWLQILLSGLNEAAQRALEAMLNLDEMKEQTVFYRDGLAKGETRGALGEARKAVARVLSKRGLALTAAQQSQLDSCTDLGTLERWLDQAITASTADDALA